MRRPAGRRRRYKIHVIYISEAATRARRLATAVAAMYDDTLRRSLARLPDSVNVYPPTSDNWTRGRQSIYSIHCRSPAQSESIARLSTKPRLFGVIRRLSTRPGRPPCWYSAYSTVRIRAANVRLQSALLPPQNHLKVPFHSGVESTCGRDRDARGKHLCRLPQSRIATNLTGLWFMDASRGYGLRLRKKLLLLCFEIMCHKR